MVVITGDLTDAKSANKLDSVQYQSEWDDFLAGIRQIESKGIGFDIPAQILTWHLIFFDR